VLSRAGGAAPARQPRASEHRTLFGVSTSAIRSDNGNFGALLRFEPDVVEFYNYPSSMLPRIAQFCGRHDIIPALHVPTPYDGPRLTRFAPSGPDCELLRAARDMTIATIVAAADLGALHVVVHYPSPYPPFETLSAARQDAFFEPVLEAAETHGVALLVENVTDNTFLCGPDDYAALLSRYPGLGFCLDLGHAHLLGHAGRPSAFVEALRDRVRSAHVYNVTPDRYRTWGHEPVRADQSPDAGWIDLREAAAAFNSLPSLRSLVYEVGDAGTGNQSDAVEGWAWFRHLIRGD
jgi:sugar phosphate isomerase/epimerase